MVHSNPNGHIFHDGIESSLEIKAERIGQYLTKIFSSGVSVKYLCYGTDVKCYEEEMNDRKVHIIKGNNTEITVTNDEDSVIVIGDNNVIYCNGERHNIVLKGLRNYVYSLYSDDSSINNKQINVKEKLDKVDKLNAFDLFDLKNIKNPLSSYFV